VREAKQLDRYGIAATKPVVDYPKLLDRVREVVEEVHVALDARSELEGLGVSVFEQNGLCRFDDENTIKTESGLRVESQKFIICAGGHNRQIPFPGVELTASHSDAWSLKEIPDSMIIIGAGASGAQVASIFNAFGTKISMFEIAPRMLITEDEDVSTAVAEAFRVNGINVVEGFEGIESVERIEGGYRFRYRLNGELYSKHASSVVLAIGWVANVEGLNLEVAGVELDRRGYIKVNEYLQTSASHVFAAGDINGRVMLVPSSSQEGYTAASNAVGGLNYPLKYDLVPTGSFTDPEYATIGLTEAQARELYDCVVSVIDFDKFPRSIIDGRTTGFCKLIADRHSHEILGCHVVGERAVETVQLVAAGMAAGLTVETLSRIPLSFPTYVGIVGWAAYDIVEQLGLHEILSRWQPHRILV
jgi:pyruvate/2-oxoglutarate dehydrogenase complex dihydrolipoamide dehydrogenase (E3) component